MYVLIKSKHDKILGQKIETKEDKGVWLIRGLASDRKKFPKAKWGGRGGDQPLFFLQKKPTFHILGEKMQVFYRLSLVLLNLRPVSVK